MRVVSSSAGVDVQKHTGNISKASMAALYVARLQEESV